MYLISPAIYRTIIETVPASLHVITIVFALIPFQFSFTDEVAQ